MKGTILRVNFGVIYVLNTREIQVKIKFFQVDESRFQTLENV